MTIPSELTKIDNWVVWKMRDGRKIPVVVGTGAPASSTNPDHWSSYKDAVDYLTATPDLSGLGFVFTEELGLIGIDIDECISGGEITPELEDMLDSFESYAEISPSGTGVKIFGKGRPIGRGRKITHEGFKMEFYSTGRFFTVTGNTLGTPELADVEGTVDYILHQHQQDYYQPDLRADIPDVGDRPVNWREQVIKYLDKCDPSVEGAEGDKQLFKVASIIACKFDLSYDELLEFLEHYNSRSDPPWNFRELEHKAKYAMMSKASCSEVGSGYQTRIEVDTDLEIVERDRGIPESLMSVPPFMKAIMDTITAVNSRDSKELALAGAIGIMAHACGRRFVDESGCFTNLYSVVLAPSSGGKQAVVEMTKYFFDRTNHADSLIGRVTSDSAIAKRLSCDPSSMAIWDEFGLFLQKTNQSNSHMNSIQSVLLELWGATKNLWRAKSYADVDFDIQVAQPCFSFVGMTTAEHFWAGLNRMHLRDGFAGRLLVIDTGARAERKEPIIDNVVMEKVAKNINYLTELHRDRTRTINGKVFPDPYVIPATEDAKNEFDKLLAYTDQFIDEIELGSIWGRAIEKAKKLAMIHAIAKDPNNPVIDGDSAFWGVAFTLWATEDFIKGTKTEVLSDGTEVGEITREVLSTIKDHENCTLASLVKECMKPTVRVKEVLDMLETAGMVERKKLRKGKATKEVYSLR